MVVNVGGMCWAMTTGSGKPAGILGRIFESASGPPVETPMATISTRLIPAAFGRAGILGKMPGAAGLAAAGGLINESGNLDTALILGINSCSMLCAVASRFVLLGLHT